MVRKKNVLTPLDIGGIFTWRGLLEEGFPVHSGNIDATPGVDVDKEELERVSKAGLVAPLLNAKGLGEASSMVIGEIFNGHLPGFGRLDISLKPGLWFEWENGIGEEELEGMIEMAWLVASAGFGVVLTMGKPSRACMVAALSAFHRDCPSWGFFERSGGDTYAFGEGKTKLESLDHPQCMLAQSVGWVKADIQAGRADRLIAKLTGLEPADGLGCKAWVGQQPRIPNHDTLIEHLRTLRREEYTNKAILSWEQTSLYVKQKVAVLGVYDVASFVALGWKPPNPKSKARPPYSLICWELVTLGIFF